MGVGLNILRATDDREGLGIPVHIFQRMALDCADVKSVVALARSLKFAASSNTILGDPSGHVTSAVQPQRRRCAVTRSRCGGAHQSLLRCSAR